MDIKKRKTPRGKEEKEGNKGHREGMEEVKRKERNESLILSLHLPPDVMENTDVQSEPRTWSSLIRVLGPVNTWSSATSV